MIQISIFLISVIQNKDKMKSTLIEGKETGEGTMQFFQFSSNQVLKEQKSNRTLYYLPCYVRFKAKQIGSIDIQGLQGVISGTLLFTFYYGNLDRKIVDQFVGQGSKAILLQFSRQQSLQLKEDKGITYKEDEKARMIDFVVRQDFVCNLQGDVFYTPFEIINLYLTITIQTVVLDPKQNDGKRIDIKFNSMTSKEVVLLGHSQNCKLGNYQLAKFFLDAKHKSSEKNPFRPISMTNNNAVQPIQIKQPKVHHQHSLNQSIDQISSPVKKIKKEGEDQKIKNFQYVHFRIPLYKYPGASLVSIFIPLWVLGFINLLIFFQDAAFSGRISTVATLTLAFIAFIPTINSQIPQTPYVKLVQILVYAQTFTSILLLIQSLSLTLYTDLTTYKFVWNQDGYFITSLIINLLTVAIVIALFLIHKFYWERVYTQRQNNEGKVGILKKIHWGNEECDVQFAEHYKNGKISVL